MDVAIATCAEFPTLEPLDGGLLQALRALGLDAAPLVWTDPSARFDQARLVVVRSTWDSHLRPDAFLAWADRVGHQTALHNPARVLRWNLHKGYLKAMAAQGLPVTPTEWIPAGGSLDVAAVALARGWDAVVLKPVVSAGARETYVFRAGELAEAQSTLPRLAQLGEVMLQPYLRSFETEGERSYVFVDGAFSHAVRRPPTLKTAARSFEQASLLVPLQGELALCERVLAAQGDRLLYARVDFATDNSGEPRLQELELVEPCLFLSLDPGGADRLARAIAARL